MGSFSLWALCLFKLFCDFPEKSRVKKKKLQVTLFSKILALFSIMAGGFSFLMYRESLETIKPYALDGNIIQHHFYGFYLLTVLYMGGVIIGAYLLSRNITRPIEHLTKVIGNLRNGEYHSKASDFIQSSDELGELAAHFDTMLESLEEKKKIQHILEKLHGKALTSEFMKGALARESFEVKVAVLFIDIRGFTRTSEEKAPEEIISELNHFFDSMGEVILQYDGVVDKFMGDSLMAIWGVPGSSKNDPTQAFRCAMKMARICQEEGLNIGIGLHYGRAVLGAIGGHERLDYTVIGDVVNTAFKIEKETKKMGVSLLISDEIQKRLSKSEQKKLGLPRSVLLGGRTQKVTLFSPLSLGDKIKKAS